MQWKLYVNVLLCLITLDSCLTQETADKAANPKTREIYRKIAALPQQGKVLSGQFAGYSPDTFNTDQINQIAQQTGKVPAILGCDYACGWNYKTPPQYIIDYSCNPSLKDHWNKGGLVTVNMHLPNPVSPNGGGYKDRMNLRFNDLLNTNSETGQRWHLFLDRIAEGLNDLQRAGVTVLYRPLHEMNGDWFYWCNQDSEVFKNVWRSMFNYFTHTKQLHNIIWVYSPDQSRASPSRYYPGDSYVDIVALDVYTDDPYSMKGYDEMLTLNKPFALGEVGPGTVNAGFDYTRWLSAIQSKFTRVTYFLAWNDGWSPIKNQNAWSLFNNARVINRDQLNSIDSSNGGSGGNSGSSTSAVLHDFSRGIGQWRGANVVGGPWQSNEFVYQSTDSLKIDINLTQGGTYGLYNQDQSANNINGRKKLIAQARVAPWGFGNNGVLKAKFYVKAGSSWSWYDSGEVQLNNYAATALVLDLTRIPSSQLNDIKEIGIEFISTANGGQTSAYVSYITVE